MVSSSSRLSRVVVIGAVGLGFLGGTREVAAGRYYRRVVVAPTSYVELAPAGYVFPTAYAFPTSTMAFVPTVHAATYVDSMFAETLVPPTVYATEAAFPSFGWPTSYSLPTSYVVPRTYVTRSVAYPTSYDMIATSLDCCDPCAVAVPASESYGSPATSTTTPAPASAPWPANPPKSAPVQGESSAVRSLPKSIESVPAKAKEGSTAPAGESPAMAEPTAKNEPFRQAPVDSQMPSPPAAPAAERDLGVAPVQPNPAPAVTPKPTPQPPTAKPPVAPGGEIPPVELRVPGDAEEVRRSAQRPILPAMSRTMVPPYRRTAKNLNWLEGKVLAGDSGLAEEGVRVTLSNHGTGPGDLIVLTDASGRYGVRLPDGDWTVKVTMPSGRTYAVSQLIVSQGQISDDLGRSIPSLTITR